MEKKLKKSVELQMPAVSVTTGQAISKQCLQQASEIAAMAAWSTQGIQAWQFPHLHTIFLQQLPVLILEWELSQVFRVTGTN